MNPRGHSWLLFLTLAAGCECAVPPPGVVWACDVGPCDGGEVQTPDAGDGGSCVPHCPMVGCGTVGDGCGGMKDCGECMPGSICSQGQCIQCTPDDAGDLPDEGNIDSNCDGVDGDAARAIFVDPLMGDDQNDGGRLFPAKTLHGGLALARIQGKAMLLVSDGTLAESPLWDVGASVYGGYSAQRGWARDGGRPFLDGGALALHISGLTQGVAFERFVVQSARAFDPDGGSSFAVVVEGSQLQLRHVEIHSGHGAPGANGVVWGFSADAGTPGADGRPGVSDWNGGDPSGATLEAGAVIGVCSSSADAGIGASETSAAGGDARSEGCVAVGGASALAPSLSCTDNGPDGGNGRNGADGGTGLDGPEGGGGAAVGTVAGVVYRPADGTAGQTGFPGGPGCGGSGGGATTRNLSAASGGSGASGGTGGCGGNGGRPGQGGGASVGLLLLGSRVSFTDVDIHVGRGGPGGIGGAGQNGGLGGPGGTGGPGSPVCMGNNSQSSGSGGNGGRGGRGGNGGQAGGGGGGPTYGIWCIDAGIAYVPGGIAVTLLGGGDGGTPSGADGVAVTIDSACQP